MVVVSTFIIHKHLHLTPQGIFQKLGFQLFSLRSSSKYIFCFKSEFKKCARCRCLEGINLGKPAILGHLFTGKWPEIENNWKIKTHKIIFLWKFHKEKWRFEESFIFVVKIIFPLYKVMLGKHIRWKNERKVKIKIWIIDE